MTKLIGHSQDRPVTLGKDYYVYRVTEGIRSQNSRDKGHRVLNTTLRRLSETVLFSPYVILETGERRNVVGLREKIF